MNIKNLLHNVDNVIFILLSVVFASIPDLKRRNDTCILDDSHFQFVITLDGMHFLKTLQNKVFILTIF